MLENLLVQLTKHFSPGARWLLLVALMTVFSTAEYCLWPNGTAHTGGFH